jgi:protein-L-isoaspartate(D-aspartate) O-methyltransferase
VTAAPDHVPRPLIEQLKAGGRMVIPVGPQDLEQDLFLINKEVDGHSVTEKRLSVLFVPLTREQRSE